jgi:phenazine biosynthesis protein phzE
VTAARPRPASLDRLLAPDPGPFALIHRPSVTGAGVIEILYGRTSRHADLAGVQRNRDRRGPSSETLLVVPFRQARERGFTVVDDGCDLISLDVETHEQAELDDVLQILPEEQVQLEHGGFETVGAAYVEQIRAIIAKEIGQGEGSNFVIRRTFTGQLAGYDLRTALTLYRRLLEVESNAYWTFLISTGDQVFVGASPERHLSCSDGIAVMNPISGTYRYPPSGPDLGELMEFLYNRKETDELTMVVDEELKMMTAVCERDVRVTGPFLKEMARLAHTEYYVQGRTTRSAIELLRATLFPPTVVGSPLENAYRVIARHEDAGRRYYSGSIALISADPAGGETLDSAILIRTAEIDRHGRIDLSVGATLVRHSDPASEVAETEAKAASLLGILTGRKQTATTQASCGLADRPEVVASLAVRNERLAGFWLGTDAGRSVPTATFEGKRALVLDCEDTFTAMLAYQLRSLGLEVTVREVRDPSLQASELDAYDLVVLGPGPGDPTELSDPKIARMRELTQHILAMRLPLLAVCLGHQVLSMHLGLPVIQLEATNQGAHHEIDLFGTPRWVGFYNTFVASSPLDEVEVGGLTLEICRDRRTGHVHAMRAPGVRSAQFHAESILTQDGVDLLAEWVGDLLPAAARGRQRW